MNRILFALMVLAAGMTAAAENAKIVFLAGPPSHGPGDHEHRAGCLLLKSCLDKVPGVTSEVYSNGWPQNPEAAFAGAATLVVYSDGGGGHPLLQDDRLKTVGDLMKKGVGLVCLHYAVEPTKEKGEKEFLDWIGGCFETDWSVNPTWRSGVQAAADTRHHARSEPVQHQRRVVLPHALPRRHEGRACRSSRRCRPPAR